MPPSRKLSNDRDRKFFTRHSIGLGLLLTAILPGRMPAQIGPPPAAARDVATERIVQIGLGYSFRLPLGWTSEETSEGALLMPAGASFDPKRLDNPEVYLAALRNEYDPTEESQVVEELSAAIAQKGGRGGQREAVTFGARSGSIYRWDVRDPQSKQQLAAFDIYLATEGSRAFVMIAAGEKTRVRANDASVRQILASMALSTPKPGASGPLSDSTELANRWLSKLRGKVIRQFWASQGMSSDKRHWLKSDGTYEYKSKSMVSVDVPGASGLSTGADDSTGRWSIRDVSGDIFLEVHYNNGKVRRMRITEDRRNWYLNGEKAFAVDPE